MTDITKRLLAALLATTMLFGITACGDDAEPDTDEPGTSDVGS